MNKIKATVSTFTEYWNAIYELSMQAKRKNLVLLYRGHGDRKYKCQPGIFRESNKNLDEQYQYNKIIQDYPEEFSKHAHLSNLVKMQHYGVETRLLDFTINPLVALYFAVEAQPKKDGEVIVILEERQKILTHYSDRALMLSCLPPLPSKVKYEIKQFCHTHTNVITDGCLARNNSDAMKKLLHEIRGEYPSFETAIVGQDLLDWFCVFAKKDNERMKKQHGLFAIFGLNEEENVEKLERNAIRIVIPKNSKKRLLGELSLMQINSEYIYPGLERKAMLNINRRANWISVDI